MTTENKTLVLHEKFEVLSAKKIIEDFLDQALAAVGEYLNERDRQAGGGNHKVKLAVNKRVNEAVERMKDIEI